MHVIGFSVGVNLSLFSVLNRLLNGDNLYSLLFTDMCIFFTCLNVFVVVFFTILFSCYLS